MAANNVLILSRRALVISAAALVVAVIALVAALRGGSGSGTAESEASGQARADAAAAVAEADRAAAAAEEAAANATAAEAAFAEALAAADGTVTPAVIAALEAQMAEAKADAAAALAAVNATAAETASETDATDDATASETDATAAETAPETGTAGEDDAGSEPEDAAAVEDDAGTAPEDTPGPDDADAVRLPGEPSDSGPSEGARLAVVGVSHSSALNVRDIPNGEIIARLDNLMDGARDPVLLVRRPNSDDIIARLDLERGVVATGNTRKLRTTVWHEFRFGDLTGWSSDAFLAQAGATDDATAEVVAKAGELPEADTMLELGMAVARTMASEQPPSRVVVSEAPGLFEGLGQMTVDVVGIGDDSILGYRLVVFFLPAAEDWMQDDPGPFTLKSVERTVLCHSHRGVSGEGLCD